MMTFFLIVLFIVGLAVLLLAIRILLVPKGTFPQTHISGNDALRRRGIRCAKGMDAEERSKKNLFTQ